MDCSFDAVSAIFSLQLRLGLVWVLVLVASFGQQELVWCVGGDGGSFGAESFLLCLLSPLGLELGLEWVLVFAASFG